MIVCKINKNISEVYLGDNPISEVYVGANKVFPSNFFCKLSLNDGSTVNIEGSGELKSTMIKPYSATCVNADIGNLCTSIGQSAFDSCSRLTSVTIPNSVTNIKDKAFFRCSGLKSVIIPNSVTSIGIQAFQICSGLTSIEIPNSVTYIGSWAFEACSRLSSISVQEGNTVYDSRNNCNAIIETATNTLVVGCKNTVIPTSVTSIGECAFLGCSGLTSITIPNSVTSIGSSAFSLCSGLALVTLGDNVERIFYGAFYDCSSLTEITFPNKVNYIDYAFANNTSVHEITIMNTTVPSGRGLGDLPDGGVLKVPSSSIQSYTEAWGESLTNKGWTIQGF